MGLKELEVDINEKNIHGFYLFYGEEKYTIKLYIEKMKKCFKNLQKGVNYFELDKSNIDSLYDLTQSVSFLGLEKLIVVKDTGLKFNKSVLENINNSKLVVIFVEDSVDKRTQEYKLLLKVANVIELNKMTPKEAVNFVKKTLNGYKIKVSEDTANYLVSVCTLDKENLINEFRKIVAYLKEGEELNKETIDNICSRTIDAKVFDLIDMVLERKYEKALSYLDDLLKNGTYIGVITSLMFKSIKQMYQIKLANSDKSITDMSKEFGIHPYTLSKLKKLEPLYTVNNLEEIMLLFDKYDENSKTSKIDSTLGLKQLILQI